MTFYFLAHSGQRARALKQFAHCRQHLQNELAIPPDAETVALERRIRHAKQTPPHRVPPGGSRFVGRTVLLAQLHNHLDDPACTLLTLGGMGGSGKTRLAVEAAHKRKGDYLNGIFFVPLTSITSRFGIAVALAEALQFEADGERPLEQQLIEHLQDQEALLIFDNFEQVVDAGVPFLKRLLDACRRLKLLVTSRERLHLRAERLLNIGSIARRADALALFQQVAEPHYRLTAADEPTVWQICQIVASLPLGIELAAATLAYQTLSQILVELQVSSASLQTSQRDTPPRQRSIAAVFDYSWRLLDATEQRVLANCALFLGGFTKDAAFHVADARRQSLRNLVDKSLLHIDANGRFHIHELLREYSAEKISNLSERRQVAAAYFLALLTDLVSDGGTEALRRVSAEWENIEAALHWCAEQSQLSSLNKALDPLCSYCYLNSSYHHAIDILQRIQTEINDPHTQARLRNRLAHFYILTSQLDNADATLASAKSTLPSNDAVEQAILLRNQGNLAAVRSDYAAARQHFRASLTLCSAPAAGYNPTDTRFGLILPIFYLDGADPAVKLARQVVAEYADQANAFQLARARTRLADVIEKQGDWREAERILRENLTYQQTLGDELGMARTYALLADKLGWQAQYEEAIVYCRQSLDSYYRLGVPLSIAIQLGNLGTYYHMLANYAEAQSLYEESLRLSKQLEDRIGTVYMLQNLGELCQDDGRPNDAIEFWRRSLDLAVALNVTDRILHAIAGLAITQRLAADPEQAQALLRVVVSHRQTVQATVDYVEAAGVLISAETNPSLTLTQAIALCSQKGP